MKITYDKEADAAYIYFSSKSVVATKGEWPFHIDIDEGGEIVGLEVMDASKILSQSLGHKVSKILKADITKAVEQLKIK